MALSLLLLMYRFFADFYNLTVRLTVETWHELIVGVLNMIDIVLTANLVLIVVSSGYENFIHKIEESARFARGFDGDRFRCA